MPSNLFRRLGHNHISWIAVDDFQGLTKLQRLCAFRGRLIRRYLDNNDLRGISDYALQDLGSLSDL